MYISRYKGFTIHIGHQPGKHSKNHKWRHLLNWLAWYEISLGNVYHVRCGGGRLKCWCLHSVPVLFGDSDEHTNIFISSDLYSHTLYGGCAVKRHAHSPQWKLHPCMPVELLAAWSRFWTILARMTSGSFCITLRVWKPMHWSLITLIIYCVLVSPGKA